MLEWKKTNGIRNKPYEVLMASHPPYEFSLCKKQDKDDPCDYRLFVYRDGRHGGGYKHLCGCQSIDQCKQDAEIWLKLQDMF